MQWCDGRQYEGYWDDGRMHGKGTLVSDGHFARRLGAAERFKDWLASEETGPRLCNYNKWRTLAHQSYHPQDLHPDYDFSPFYEGLADCCGCSSMGPRDIREAVVINGK